MKKRLSVKGVNKIKLLELATYISCKVGGAKKPNLSLTMSYVLENLDKPFTNQTPKNAKLICVNLDNDLILKFKAFALKEGRSQGALINSTIVYLLNNKKLLPR